MGGTTFLVLDYFFSPQERAVNGARNKSRIATIDTRARRPHPSHPTSARPTFEAQAHQTNPQTTLKPKTMSTRPSTTKRSTTTTFSSTIPAARPPCDIHPTAIIADKAQLTGSHPVTIAEHAVLHPYARIRAEGGRVTIGPYCIIAEGAVVGLPEGQTGDVELERYVSVESGAEVEASSIGEATEVGVQSKIGKGAVLGRFCRVTPTEVVGDGERVGDFEVIFGEGKRRVDKTLLEGEEVQRLRVQVHRKHVEALNKLIVDGKAKWVE